MCKKNYLSVLLLLAIMLTVAGCYAGLVRGSGDLVTETRQVSNFDSIDLSGVGEVSITHIPRQARGMLVSDLITREPHSFDVQLAKAIGKTSVHFTIKTPEFRMICKNYPPHGF